MPTSALLLILLSAAMHAGWNLILKTTRHKLPFNVFMHAFAIAIFSAYWLLRYGAIPPPSGPVLPLALAGGFFFSIYHMCLTASYERTDVSLAYPLTTTGPLYIPLWAYLFLDERLSLLGMAGILVVFLGAYILQMRKLSWTGLSFPLRNIRHPGVLLAFSAGVFYSVGAIVDKADELTEPVSRGDPCPLAAGNRGRVHPLPLVHHIPPRPPDVEGVLCGLRPSGKRHRGRRGGDSSLPGAVRAHPPFRCGPYRPGDRVHQAGVAT